MTYAEKQSRKRMSLSLLIAFLFHGAAFLAFHYLLPLQKDKIPDYSGPIVVTIGTEASLSEQASSSSTVVETEKNKTAMPAAKPAQKSKLEGAAKAERSKASREGEELDIKAREKAPIPPEDLSEVSPSSYRSAEQVKETQKALPFKPGTVITDEPLAFNVQKLDEALEAPGGDEQKSSSLQGTEGALQPAAKEQGGAAAGSASGTSAASPVILWDDAGSRRLLIQRAPEPDIPFWVKKEGVDLKVVVAFSVTPDGQTVAVRTELSSGFSDVDSAVLEAVRKMKFNPVQGEKQASGRVSYLIRTK